MELLSAGPENLASSLPSAGASTDGSSPAVQKLKQLMENVETIKVSSLGSVAFRVLRTPIRASLHKLSEFPRNFVASAAALQL